MPGPLRVAVVALDAVGHLNPTLSIAAAIARSPGRADVRVHGSGEAAAVARSAGLQDVRLPDAVGPAPAVSDLTDLARTSFVAPQAGLPHLVEVMRAFRPEIVVHDVFDLRGPVAALALGVPRVAVVGFGGLRSLGPGFAEEHARGHAELERANDRLVRSFGLDVLGEPHLLPVLFPSRDLTLVTALPEQEPGPPPVSDALERVRAKVAAATVWSGPCTGRTYWGARFDSRRSEEFLRRTSDGDLRVYLSLGTNIAAFRRAHPMGGCASGREFLARAVEVTVEAFGDRPDVRVLMALGRDASARTLPPNMRAAVAVDQQRVLAEHADVFLTHHGFNSTVDAIVAQVPMVSLPGYGDQLANAAFCVAEGVAVAPWDLARAGATCTGGSMREAVAAATSADGPPARLAGLRRRLLEPGGEDACATRILDLARAVR